MNKSEPFDGFKCLQCGKKHNTLLHWKNIHSKRTSIAISFRQVYDRTSQNTTKAFTVAKTSDESKVAAAMIKKGEVSLQTAIVHVNVLEETVRLRILLDSASQNN